MEIFDKIRQVLCFLVECLSSWIAMGRRDGPVQDREDKRLITAVVLKMMLSYTSRDARNEQLWNLLLDERERMNDEREHMYHIE